uniref:Uncharacterized protein n=1 Tax=Kalanchoe fedtschenkoi TaxID=63787 RepID=A0A7N0T490_KALFE
MTIHATTSFIAQNDVILYSQQHQIHVPHKSSNIFRPQSPSYIPPPNQNPPSKISQHATVSKNITICLAVSRLWRLPVPHHHPHPHHLQLNSLSLSNHTHKSHKLKNFTKPIFSPPQFVPTLPSPDPNSSAHQSTKPPTFLPHNPFSRFILRRYSVLRPKPIPKLSHFRVPGRRARRRFHIGENELVPTQRSERCRFSARRQDLIATVYTWTVAIQLA